VRPKVAFAVGPGTLERATLQRDELAKRLGSRFTVLRYSSGIGAIARLAVEQPDALVVAFDDPTLRFPGVFAALREDPVTAYIALAVILGDEVWDLALTDVALRVNHIEKLPGELARSLAIA
jgi:hypothetical protein